MGSRAVAVVVVAAAVTGCFGEPCDGGDTACAGDGTLLVCRSIRNGHAVSHEWEAAECPALNPYCVSREVDPDVTPQRRGSCAAGDARTAECAANPDGCCRDGVCFVCTDGYPIAAERCGGGCFPDGDACAP